MFQIRIIDSDDQPLMSVLANGVIELIISSTGSLESAIKANQEFLIEAVISQFVDLFGSRSYRRAFEKTNNGIVIRPRYCKLVNVCLESEYPMP